MGDSSPVSACMISEYTEFDIFAYHHMYFHPIIFQMKDPRKSCVPTVVIEYRNKYTFIFPWVIIRQKPGIITHCTECNCGKMLQVQRLEIWRRVPKYHSQCKHSERWWCILHLSRYNVHDYQIIVLLLSELELWLTNSYRNQWSQQL